MERLYFADNLQVLRENLREASVDLIYLDPPFNSKRHYNLLFKGRKGGECDAQITAFEDTWRWGEPAEREYREILGQANTEIAEIMRALRSFLGENDLMAYLVMMANRLIEMHRVLKPTGSLYLHCDPTASHYLKLVLDGVFGKENFRTEISWKRSSAHNDGKQGRRQCGNIRDLVLFYTKSDCWTWNRLYTPYDKEYIEAFYRHIEPETGRRYRLGDLTGPGGAGNGNPLYEVMGVKRYWRYSEAKMGALVECGRIVQTKPGAVPAYKRYLDEMPGVPLQNDWNDIQPANGKESLGYQTQKPLALLERIIQASSNEGDVVLDPFCGCGTAVHAAHKLKRRWIGIDITHLAISLIERRLKDAFPGIRFQVHGTPKDMQGAQALAARDKYQFQWWACSLLNAQPYKKKGADGGVDGLIFFQDDRDMAKKIVISVKGGEHVNVAMIRDLKGVIERDRAAIGVFLTLAQPSQPMRKEAAAAGFYSSPAFNAPYPKLQILTVEGVLNGTERVRCPDVSAGRLTFKKTAREAHPPVQQTLLLGS